MKRFVGAIMLIAICSAFTVAYGMTYDIPPPPWYNHEKQSKMQIPNDVILHSSKNSPQTPKSFLNVDVFFPLQPTHKENLPAGVVTEGKSTSEVVHQLKKIEEQKALELMKKLGY